MKEFDLSYLASTMSRLCGMPARIYTNGIKTNLFSLINFPKDPCELVEDKIKNINNNIGYLNDQYFYYYGYVRCQNKLLLLGPARLIKADNQLINNLILDLNIDKENKKLFKDAIESLTQMPLESIMEALSSLNYVLNNEKTNLADIMVNYQKSNEYQNRINQIVSNSRIDNLNEVSEHNTFDIEQNIMRIVEHGEILELKEWIKNAPSVRGGVLSTDVLRQLKNTFIATTTLVSRAAIKGGLDVNDSLTLSDLYIQKSELLNDYNDIVTLQMNMIMDYTEKVARIHGNDNYSRFLIKINKYIYSHITEAIKSKDICKALYMSKSVLFDRIKKETGKTLDEYILNFKINESKGLLKNSSKSISSISIYLGFSSQSHFNRVFKKITGTTPKRYQEDHTL